MGVAAPNSLLLRRPHSCRIVERAAPLSGCASPRTSSRLETSDRAALRNTHRGARLRRPPVHSGTCEVRHPPLQHRGSNAWSSVVRGDAGPSITRARAVTALRMLLSARCSRSSWRLRRAPLNRSRTCERRAPDGASLRRPMYIVAPSPAALHADQHVRREAPNTASPLDNRESLTLGSPELKTHRRIPTTRAIGGMACGSLAAAV